MGTKSTRDHIVESADQLFSQQGFDHTSFADIVGAGHASSGEKSGGRHPDSRFSRRSLYSLGSQTNE